MTKIRNFWETLTIKNKIRVFTGSVVAAILLAVMFVAWLVKLFMVDFNDIMEDNSRGGEIVAAINAEIEAFDQYVHSSDSSSVEGWDAIVAETRKQIYSVPLDYRSLGDERFARLQALRTAYEEYSRSRNQVLADFQADKLYVDKLYDVYSMQEYLSAYAQKYVDVTMLQGNEGYNVLAPIVFSIPYLAAALGIVLFVAIVTISKSMDRNFSVPVLKLANASRNIASNNFFIDDVVVDNKDELGEMVSAFNKMKFATGEYIKALEEKREALDQLHAQEVETLEIEKQLETMNLELLKSQINPHFLFNTLNVIAGMANLEDAATTEQMIEALSSLFRYNLKNQEKEALLSQELKIAGDYMYLQKMRFGSRVEYEVQCDVDEEKTMVPTFTFQPLIENAMIHGISPKVEGGRISVHVFAEDDILKITVADTGVGIAKDVLQAIRQQLDMGRGESAANRLRETEGEHAGENGDRSFGNVDGKPQDEGDSEILRDADGKPQSMDPSNPIERPAPPDGKVGIGLGNISRRIKAMYPDSHLSIDSVQGEGTTITISIPLTREGGT